MQVALFGGTGRCGRLVVRRALHAHHSVSILARDASRVEQSDQRLRIVPGDALDRGTVAATLTGTEAAIVLIGMPLRNPGTVMSDATAAIVEQMHVAKVHRLLLVSADGAGDSRRELPFLTRVALPFIGAFMTEKEDRLAEAQGRATSPSDARLASRDQIAAYRVAEFVTLARDGSPVGWPLNPDLERPACARAPAARATVRWMSPDTRSARSAAARAMRSSSPGSSERTGDGPAGSAASSAAPRQATNASASADGTSRSSFG